ncbi:MAG: hypothetical protein KME54_14925 [Tolypothrix brevis GSE-NOS-MK-07-07A]|jgi:sensor histidine kinase regulating citrate/malate metabolism|nr:hypothetical protein [Tolypothrix brevis GSE-NOS-MK-07-07A]
MVKQASAIAFVGIAIASWTSLLQVAAIVEARDEAEHLFKVALDNENGHSSHSRISYQIVVDKHQGKIECISQPGEGAEFWVEIPIRQIK